MQGNYQISTKILNDNSILVYGGYNPVKVIKYSENGIIDNTYGINGEVEVGTNIFPWESDISFSNNNLILLSDGSVIVRYFQNPNSFLKKLLPNGTTTWSKTQRLRKRSI